MNIFDTQTACHLLDENLPSKALKYLAEHILKVSKEQIKKYDEVDVNSDEFYTYALNDAIWTYQLYQIQAPQLEKESLHHLFYDIEMPFQYALRDLVINGIGVDVDTARQLRYDVRHLYYTIEKEMLDMWGGCWEIKCTPRSKRVTCEPSINFNSSDQVIPLIESLGFEIYEKSKKGKKSWGKQAKNRLKGQHPFIDLLIKFGKVEKLLSSFLNPFEEFVDADNRIRSSFHNTVAVTGRLSCSCPNIEQLPKNNDIARIRNLFTTGGNSIFIVADYSGQELRVLGEETQDSGLIKGLTAGLDIHQENADEFGISRNEAKSISFGVAYGKGAYGFAKDFNCTEKEAQKFLDGFFNKYPRVRTRIEQCHKKLHYKEYITNLSGRKRRFPGYLKLSKWKRERCQRQAFNFLIQSFSADMIKIAAAKCIQDKHLKLVNIVHDELVFEVPRYYIKRGTMWIRECMVNAVKMSIPLEVDISYGIRYGEAK